MCLWMAGFLLGCSPECREPSVEIGAGTGSFKAMTDEVELVHGAQGGTHVDLSARVCGLESVSVIDIRVSAANDGVEPFEQQVVWPTEGPSNGCCVDFNALRAFVPSSYANAQTPGGEAVKSVVEVFVVDPSPPPEGFVYGFSHCVDGLAPGWQFDASVYGSADVMLATVWSIDHTWSEEHTVDWVRGPLSGAEFGEEFSLLLPKVEADSYEPNVNTTLDCEHDPNRVVTAFRHYDNGIMAGCRIVADESDAIQLVLDSPDIGPNSVSRPEELWGCEQWAWDEVY